MSTGVQPGTPAYRRVVVALFAAGVATFALLYSTQALLPVLATRFGVSAGASAWSLSATTLGLAVALLVVGPLSDRYGRTPLIHASVLLASLVGLACALAPSWPALVGLRLLEGVALAGLPAVATAYLREELHPGSQARAVGLYVAGTAIGGMAGRLLTGAVAGAFGWRWALASAAALGLVCAVVVRVLLPASRQFVPRPAGLHAVLGTARQALSDRGLLALFGIGGCSMGVLTVLLNTVGFRLALDPFHLGLAAASLLFCVYPVGSLSSALSGRLADRYGRRAVLPIGCVVALLGVLLTIPASLPLLVVGLALVIAGFFAVHGVASGWVPARAHAAGLATAQAASLYLFAYYVGASVFGALGGQAWNAAGWPSVVVLAAGLVVVLGVLALVLRRTPTLLVAVPQPRTSR
ncbi:MFS transporter [Microlunatus flavus]|uniref:MFS transporter, YNFM family, putative membrane transport protein n=1 Tax=Microlunatus flavus TaxID=1036181 RepID=A0A1H9GE24_9ACTN|nr:MFS transporter [Microlunatus flavus]SEQ48326.1 MFS transporter, YNFM family, putative membrane transport protein [Microlunatus flavus]